MSEEFPEYVGDVDYTMPAPGSEEPMYEPHQGRDYVEVVVQESDGKQWEQAVPAWERDLYQRQGTLVKDRGDSELAARQDEVRAGLAAERGRGGDERDR